MAPTDAQPPGITLGVDGYARCGWADQSQDYRAYHDTEWGVPVCDDIRLFEKLTLEGFQSGLSWLTILRKRASFRRAFAGFEFARVAAFDQDDVDRLLADAGIIRHRGKIEAAISNAGCAVELVAAEGSLAAYVWGFEPPARPGPLSHAELNGLAVTPESTALAKDLKRRGWRFVGPTTAYAFMQSMGLVNDHVAGCHAYEPVEAARRLCPRPRLSRGAAGRAGAGARRGAGAAPAGGGACDAG